MQMAASKNGHTNGFKKDVTIHKPMVLTKVAESIKDPNLKVMAEYVIDLMHKAAASDIDMEQFKMQIVGFRELVSLMSMDRLRRPNANT